MKTLKRIIYIILVIHFSFSLLWPQDLGTRARIEEKGSDWTMDKGTAMGVVVGMEGYLMKKSYSSAQKKFIHQKIAHFKVFRVFKLFSYARVDRWSNGFSAKDAQWAQFIKNIAPPKGTKKTVKPMVEKKVEAGKTQRWYLDKGDASYDLGKYSQALSYYYKVLEIDPDDPGAKLRVKTAKAKYFLRQGDLDYGKNEFHSAYEYFIMAFQILEENNFLAAEKVVDLWSREEGFFEKMKEYEISPAVLLESLFKYCDRLLTERKLDKLATLAQKMIRFVSADELKYKLETLMKAKEIQGDIDNNGFNKLLDQIEAAISGNNLYKAHFIIEKMEKVMMDDGTRNRLTAYKDKLASKQIQMQIDRTILQKESKIKKLEAEAKGFIAIKNYDEAINRYLEIYKEQPEKVAYSKKIKDLQLEKFNYEKFQKQIKARVEVDNLILYAEDSFKQELMQDALDYYIKAYKIFPEEGKAVAGIVKVLENCSPTDANYITPALLERKLSKFSKDFLHYIEKKYLNVNDAIAFKILSNIGFIKNNPDLDQLILKIKDNLYEINLKLGHQEFRKASFDEASQIYTTALGLKETDVVKRWIEVCGEMNKVQNWLRLEKKKSLNLYLDGQRMRSDKYDILEGMLNLSEKFMLASKFKSSKYLRKKVATFKVAKFADRISQLKQKEKYLKKK
jgi:tetratricopeptide (TPR) repeat protein